MKIIYTNKKNKLYKYFHASALSHSTLIKKKKTHNILGLVCKHMNFTYTMIL